jgi:hypothetical protein
MRESTLNPLCTITKITPTINKKIGCRRTVTHSSNQPPPPPHPLHTHPHQWLSQKLQVSFLQTITHNQHTDTPTPPRPPSTHTTQTTADCFPQSFGNLAPLPFPVLWQPRILLPPTLLGAFSYSLALALSQNPAHLTHAFLSRST